MTHPEYYIQKSICNYLNVKHPDLLFMSDTVASVKLTKGQAGRNKAIQKDGFKTPDLIIFEPMGKYSGLFLELKVKSPFKKNGELYSNDHLKGQQKTIDDLKKKGYFATFSVGFNQSVKFIEDYLKGEL